MNEIIQQLKTNATNGKENFCYISENKLNAIKQLSKIELQEKTDLQSQLDIANKKLKEIQKHCELSTTYEFNEIKNGHNSFDHQRIINNNNDILSIIGGE